MNILLFGGSFDPPHLGHQFVISAAFELIPNIDELWLLPTHNHTFNKQLSPTNHRLKMCELLVNDTCRDIFLATQGAEGSRVELKKYAERKNNPKIKICSIEIDNQTSGSTYESLQLLNTKYPQHTYSFLMGSDQLPNFKKWEHWSELLEKMHFYVYPRGSHRYPVTFQNMTLIESPTQIITNISSTLIRQRIQQQLPVDHLLPPSIYAYIQQHHLY